MACCLVAAVAMFPEVQRLLAEVVLKSAQRASSNLQWDGKFSLGLWQNRLGLYEVVLSPFSSPLFAMMNFIVTIWLPSIQRPNV